MPRSNRRCAVSLQEGAKWTVPRRWSVSSCAGTDGAKDVAAAATAITVASLILLVMRVSRTAHAGQICRTDYQGSVPPAIYPPVAERELSLPARSATARLSQEKAAHDPALYTTGHGRDLGAADALPDLVRDRGARGRRHGRAWHHPESGGQDDLGQGQERDLRRRAHR